MLDTTIRPEACQLQKTGLRLLAGQGEELQVGIMLFMRRSELTLLCKLAHQPLVKGAIAGKTIDQRLQHGVRYIVLRLENALGKANHPLTPFVAQLNQPALKLGTSRQLQLFHQVTAIILKELFQRRYVLLPLQQLLQLMQVEMPAIGTAKGNGLPRHHQHLLSHLTQRLSQAMQRVTQVGTSRRKPLIGP